MNIGAEKRTVYIEPIEEAAAVPVEEPSPPIDPEPAEPRPQTEPATAG
ncbi:MAG TPA: hypothetical protein VGR49_00800 [Actinomycetota bacterium]|jgi:hypothetical protein|nr:hypothetical protein [Actinomycetota bacterium]